MVNIFHRIKAILIPNLLTDDPKDLYAKVTSERTLDIPAICKTAVTRGGAPTTEQAMKINVELFLEEMSYQLKDGYAVNTGYFTATPQIRGVFRNTDDRFDPARHTIYFQFGQGDILRKGLNEVQVEITGVSDAGISIVKVTDVKTKSVDDLITPGRNLRIKGSKLKLEGDHPDVGVWFVNQATQVRVRVEADDVVDNNPSELMIVVPNLDPGLYVLEVCSQHSGAQLLKAPRTAVFKELLTVV